MRDRNPARQWILGGAMVLAAAGAAHAQIAYSDLWSSVFTKCVNCHNADQSGGMRFGSAEDLRRVAVNVPSSRSNSAKLRVHPYAPELSFLVDKLRGHVKAGEGDPMPRDGAIGLVYGAPGHVAAVEEWIRAGAPACQGAKGSETCPTFGEGFLQLGKPQPPFDPVQPEGTLLLEAEDFTVSHLSTATTITREGIHESAALTAGNPSPTNVTRIQIEASAGTVSVELYRGDEEIPLAVARGTSLDLQLPEGVGVPIDANQTFRIVQRIRNDYFLAPGEPGNPESGARYHNLTRGEAVVYLTTTDEVVLDARPFVDTTGTDVLFVPAQRIGVTGGIWSAGADGAVSGATVGVWSDERAIAAALVDPASQQLLNEGGLPEDDRTLRESYVQVGGTASIAYSCVHNNGLTNTPRSEVAFATTLANEPVAPILRPVRTACTTDRNVPSGLPVIVADALGMADEPCWRDHDPSPDPPATSSSVGSDCEGAAFCRPANLVGGPTSEDGRCTLVGLWW